LRKRDIEADVPAAIRRGRRPRPDPFYSPGLGLWLYGNERLLAGNLACVEAALGPPTHTERQLLAVEREAERLVLDGKILVCGVHHEAHRRAAIVPVRLGSPRVVVFSGGFRFHLGPDLVEEPFRAARLWRYAWDPETDLAVSRRGPDALPTYARHNPAVDRIVAALVAREVVPARSGRFSG
jgi:DNA processing protein